jgi:biopolymer transport protein TolR
MARRRQESELQAFSGINITPLMDLTFLLLIVFMITAPMLEYAINVSPPKMSADQIDHENNILISLDREGRIIFRKEVISGDRLISELRVLQLARPAAAVLIRADERRPYGEIIELMKTVRNAGLVNVSLVTEAED